VSRASKGKGVRVSSARSGKSGAAAPVRAARSGLYAYAELRDTRAPSMKPISWGKVAVNLAAGTVCVTAGPGKTLRLLSGLRGADMRVARDDCVVVVQDTIAVSFGSGSEAVAFARTVEALGGLPTLPPVPDPAHGDDGMVHIHTNIPP